MPGEGCAKRGGVPGEGVYMHVEVHVFQLMISQRHYSKAHIQSGQVLITDHSSIPTLYLAGGSHTCTSLHVPLLSIL